jgi:hypothetical protein
LLASSPPTAVITNHHSRSFRLPTKIPPSFRGSAVHYLYQAAVKAAVTPGSGSGAAPSKAAVAAAAAAGTAQALAPFLVWPKAERQVGAGAGLDGRRPSMQLSGGGGMSLSPTAAAGAGPPDLARAGSLGPPALGSGGSGGAFAAAAAAAGEGGGGGGGHQLEPELMEYRLGVADVKATWEVRGFWGWE